MTTNNVHNISEARIKRARRIKPEVLQRVARDIVIPHPSVTHWLHTCDRIKCSGWLPRGESCYWCKASEPDSDPKGAA